MKVLVCGARGFIGRHNTADPDPFRAVLGREALAPSAFVDRPHREPHPKGAPACPPTVLKWLHILSSMAQMAEAAAAQGSPLPPALARYARWWEALGYPAFIAMLGVFYLMVNKPGAVGLSPVVTQRSPASA